MSRDFDPRGISEPRLIRLLASAVRQELVDTLAALGGEASIARLADELGRPADGLYYHVRALVRGGLLVETPTSKTGEAVYRLAGDGAPLRLAYVLGPGGNGEEVVRFVRGLMQIASSDFEAATAAGALTVSGSGRELWASRNKGWLSDSDLAEVNALLERLSVLVSQPRSADRTRLASLAFCLAPLDPQPRRRRGGKRSAKAG